MQKSALIFSPLFAVLFTVAGAANAASNAQINITASVVATTCDVSVSNPNLDLGNFATGAFNKVINKPAAGSIKKFSVGLSNCETPKEGGMAKLQVTGTTLFGNNNMFNSSSDANTGIMLSRVDDANNYINAGDTLDVAKTGEKPEAGDLNGKTLELQAGLASTAATPDIGNISAPVLFSFVYN